MRRAKFFHRLRVQVREPGHVRLCIRNVLAKGGGVRDSEEESNEKDGCQKKEMRGTVSKASCWIWLGSEYIHQMDFVWLLDIKLASTDALLDRFRGRSQP